MGDLIKLSFNLQKQVHNLTNSDIKHTISMLAHSISKADIENGYKSASRMVENSTDVLVDNIDFDAYIKWLSK